ncbi:MAG: 23S rRNA (uracil(1939)-C(5))-methyltransferase RlmD [Oscillospiraceae bacterium]|nr:23S rRNA (uracil(1939)-C(5))-methyltransferase RlmD [Oscillospiraceae bacterium]
MKKNEQYQVKIVNISSDGNGVAFNDNIPIFVPYSSVGDEAVVRIERVEKRYCYGRIVDLLSPSPYRIDVDCPLFERCGGCAFRHVTYSEELRAKRQFVIDAIKRIGKIDHPVDNILHTDVTEYYRNKAQFPVGNDEDHLFPGFYAPRSHRMLQFPSACKLQPVCFDELVKTACSILEKYGCTSYDEQEHKGLIRHILVRQSSLAQKILISFIINGSSLPHQDEIVSDLISKFPAIASVSIDINTNKGNTILTPNYQTIWGEPSIHDEILGVPVEITPLSFFQINHFSTELLYSTIKSMVEDLKVKTVIDLYCGAGTIGLATTSSEQTLYGIELIDDAIESAISSAKTMNRTNAHFICGDAGEIKALIDTGIYPDLIITDPPRKGCSPEVLEQIIRSDCPNLIMVSCNAATLARDLQILAQNGYTIDSIQPIDMFPRTRHVEVISALSKIN